MGTALAGVGDGNCACPFPGILKRCVVTTPGSAGARGVSSAALGSGTVKWMLKPYNHNTLKSQLAQRRAPHSPRESVMQYGVLRLVMAGQVSVPGPYTGLLKASKLPGCAPPEHTQVMP